MKEHNFKVGSRVKRINQEGLHHKLGEERNISLLPGMKEYDLRDYLEASKGMILDDGYWTFQEDWELIESAEPRRYTGELRDGMKVWIVGVDYLDIEGREHVIRKVENEWRAYDSNDDHWRLMPKCNGEWWSQDSAAYISHVIPEPEEKKAAEATSFADGFRQFEEWRKCGMPNFCLGNEDEEEQPRKHWEKCDCFRCLPERFSELYMRTLADGFAVPVPIMAHPNCKISFKNSPHKGGIQTFMDTLRSIPAKIKRILNPNYKAFYQLEWVDEELDLTAQGRIELLDMLLDKHEAELGELAKKEVARRKKHSVQDEE